MKVVGLCGGSGSGKGTVALLFEEYGFKSIDTDRLYHEMTSYMSPCLLELIDAFGDGIVKDGQLCRPTLREMVFKDTDNTSALSLLNSITHKHIKIETEALLSKYECEGTLAVLIDAPLLFESGFDKMCSSVIAVVADSEIRLDRIIKRDGIARDEAEKRINSQISDSKLIEKSDYIIVNDGDLDTLRERAGAVAEQILKK